MTAKLEQTTLDGGGDLRVRYDDNRSGYFKPWELEIIKAAKTDPKFKFDIGDKIKCKVDRYEGVGGKGEIITVASRKMEGDMACYGFKEDEEHNGDPEYYHVERYYTLHKKKRKGLFKTLKNLLKKKE